MEGPVVPSSSLQFLGIQFDHHPLHILSSPVSRANLNLAEATVVILLSLFAPSLSFILSASALLCFELGSDKIKIKIKIFKLTVTNPSTLQETPPKINKNPRSTRKTHFSLSRSKNPKKNFIFSGFALHQIETPSLLSFFRFLSFSIRSNRLSWNSPRPHFLSLKSSLPPMEIDWGSQMVSVLVGTVTNTIGQLLVKNGIAHEMSVGTFCFLCFSLLVLAKWATDFKAKNNTFLAMPSKSDVFYLVIALAFVTQSVNALRLSLSRPPEEIEVDRFNTMVLLGLFLLGILSLFRGPIDDAAADFAAQMGDAWMSFQADGGEGEAAYQEIPHGDGDGDEQATVTVEDED